MAGDGGLDPQTVSRPYGLASLAGPCPVHHPVIKQRGGIRPLRRGLLRRTQRTRTASP